MTDNRTTTSTAWNTRATLGAEKTREDAIKGLEADIWRSCEHLTTANNGEILVNVPWEKLREWFAIAATLGRKELERENSKLEHKMSNMETKLLKAQERIDELNATLGSERHPYEQRITGDGSDWGEIMCNAYDDLIASACESCTPEQIGQLADHIRAELGSEINGDTSDGYHTFNELYHHRAVLFSVIVRDHRELAWKARKHHDGTMYEGMFIVGIETPKGQATYHYNLDPYWEMFDCEEREYAPEWDGHTPDEAIARIAELGSGTCELIDTTSPANDDYWNSAMCSECGAGFTCAIFGRDRRLPDANYCPNCGRKAVG